MTGVLEAGFWQGAERARLVRLCAVLTGDREVAEDLAQETLLEAWRHRDGLTDAAGADRWLSAIARNVCLRWARTRGRLPVPLAELPEGPAPAEEGIADLLELLPPGTRRVMEQRYVAERSLEEIAATLGISADAVAMRLARGKRALYRILAADDWQPSRTPCLQCGTGNLLMRRTASEIEFTCVCATADVLVRYPLGNPQFARLVGGLERPTAMFRRVGDWALRYFAGGDGGRSTCTRCARPVTVRAHVREGGIHGLYALCDSCGEEIWSSLAALAGALPAVRGLGRRCLVDVREERSVVAVVHASLDGARRVEVGFDRSTHALLGAA
jgi:RNA polymerase sigma-70 factor (ECF subfamily)